MFEVIATVLIVVAVLVSLRVAARREHRLIAARRRRAQHAEEFETRTGMYSPERTAGRSDWELAR